MKKKVAQGFGDFLQHNNNVSKKIERVFWERQDSPLNLFKNKTSVKEKQGELPLPRILPAKVEDSIP